MHSWSRATIRLTYGYLMHYTLAAFYGFAVPGEVTSCLSREQWEHCTHLIKYCAPQIPAQRELSLLGWFRPLVQTWRSFCVTLWNVGMLHQLGDQNNPNWNRKTKNPEWSQNPRSPPFIHTAPELLKTLPSKKVRTITFKEHSRNYEMR